MAIAKKYDVFDGLPLEGDEQKNGPDMVFTPEIVITETFWK
jgi:hypothetical protein